MVYSMNTKYNYSRKYYSNVGQLLTDENSDTVAKEVVNDDTGNIRYYIKTFRGLLLNPREGNYNMNKKKSEFKQVKQEAFVHYLKYLTNGGEAYLRSAERAML